MKRQFWICLQLNMIVIECCNKNKKNNQLNDSGSGGWIKWDQNRRSNDLSIMRSNYFASFHEIKLFCQFSWDQIILPVFMGSKFLIIIWSSDCGKFKKALLANFNLINNLLITTMIMRSKFAYNAFLNFDLMNNWLAASAVMRLNLFKFIKLHLWVIFIPNYKPSVHENFWSHDCNCG